MFRYPRWFPVLCFVTLLLLAVLPACTAPAPAPATPTKPAAAPAATTAAAPAAPTAAPQAAAPTAAPAAKVNEYNVTVITDITGPGAAAMKNGDPGRKAIFAWWNDTVGKQIGVQVKTKFYDGRNDPSNIASLWAANVATDKPVFISGFGSVDSAALQGRLPSDKVPWFSGAEALGYNWLPNQWLFFAVQTSPQNILGFLNWALADWKENRPLRLGSLASDGAGGKDAVGGVQQTLARGMFAGKVEYVGAEYVPLQVTPDVSSEMKRLLDKKPDYIAVSAVQGPNEVAALRALQQYKGTAKFVLRAGAGISQVAATTTLAELEGHFDAMGLASEIETDIEGNRIFQQYKAQAGAADAPYVSDTVWGMAYAILPLRALERAVKAVGADKVTSEAVYNAMFTGTFTSKELLGVLGDVTYTKEAPFPLKGAKVRISTVKNGKYVLATPEWVPVPEISQKWQ